MKKIIFQTNETYICFVLPKKKKSLQQHYGPNFHSPLRVHLTTELSPWGPKSFYTSTLYSIAQQRKPSTEQNIERERESGEDRVTVLVTKKAKMNTDITASTKPEYPVVDRNPPFTKVVGNFSSLDYLRFVTITGVSVTVGYLSGNPLSLSLSLSLSIYFFSIQFHKFPKLK